MRKYELDNILWGMLSIIVPIVVVFSLGYYTGEKRDGRTEATRIDYRVSDKVLLCATRIHTLEQEVDQLRNRVEDIEEKMGSGD